jgi:hypothetical protein
MPEGTESSPPDAGKILDVLRASADQEMTIAERLSGKARQAFALAAAVFTISQTVAFGNFDASQLSGHEKHWMILLAIVAVVALGFAVFSTIKADVTVDSRDLPLAALEDDLNAAYAGDPDVIGRLGSYYLGVVKTRRDANAVRRAWYTRTRIVVSISLVATLSELIFALVARTF